MKRCTCPLQAASCGYSDMFFSLLLGLAITWLPAIAVLHRIVPIGLPGRRCIIAGYGLLLGFILVTLVMRLLNLLGIPFSLMAIGVAMTLVLLLSVLIPRRVEAMPVPSEPSMSLPAKLLLSLCVVLGAAHLLFVSIEVLSTPIFSWDSKQHWAKQAKVFLEHRALVPHVKNIEWLSLYGEGVYTNLHPDYPVTLPLIQTWVAIAMGGWHDVFVNVPWLLCLVGMALVFFGQLRAAGVGVLIASIATYMLLSLPLLNAQTSLAGYADPFMSAAFLAAFAAFANWSRTRQGWQGLLVLACALTCVLLKQEGTYWAIAFVPALLVVFLGIKRGYAIIFCAIAVVILLLLFLPKNTSFAGHTIREMHFLYRPTSWLPLLEGAFVHDNWHLLAYFAVFTVGWSIASGDIAREGVAPALTVLLGILFLYLTLYLFTGYSTAAVQHTSNSRLLLHFMPGWLFMSALVYAGMASTNTQRIGDGQAH